MRIEYTQQAMTDIKDMLEYIAQDSRQHALLYLEKLKKKIRLLETFPYLGVACSTKAIKESCRILVVDSYLIFYSVAKDAIQIRRVLHESVDYNGKAL
jgi:plasmid stabilization system protein ParE